MAILEKYWICIKNVLTSFPAKLSKLIFRLLSRPTTSSGWKLVIFVQIESSIVPSSRPAFLYQNRLRRYCVLKGHINIICPHPSPWRWLVEPSSPFGLACLMEYIQYTLYTIHHTQPITYNTPHILHFTLDTTQHEHTTMHMCSPMCVCM